MRGNRTIGRRGAWSRRTADSSRFLTNGDGPIDDWRSGGLARAASACGRGAPVRRAPGLLCLFRGRTRNVRRMNPDLEHLIKLQQLDSAALDATRRLAGEPEQEKAFEERLQLASERLATAKRLLAENQEARRAIEKDVAVHQTR